MSTYRIEQLVLLKRLLIIFGSICLLWFIIGFIFLSIQTYRHFKKKTNKKFYLYNRSLQLPPSLLIPSEQTLTSDPIFDNDEDDDDDQASVLTSISLISERSKYTHAHTRYTTVCPGIPEEPFELTFSNVAGISNLAYSQSTLSSSSDNDTSLLYYPGHRNLAYSQSTLCSLDSNIHQKTPTPSLIFPSSIHQLNLIRQSSQLSTNTISSQITNATYLSSQSSMKSIPLPTVMITDVDRLQTDIIELENFEPENEWNPRKSQLRFLLNDRIPELMK